VVTLEVLGPQPASQPLLQAADAEAAAEGRHAGR
jgi:hypothetical protein